MTTRSGTKMSEVWEWPGARWWRCDFHVHSPASGDVTEDVTPDTWLEMAAKRELDAVALTDHNTGDWIDRIREAVEKNGSRPVLFPGVELTLQPGLHALILFDLKSSRDAVTAFLARCDIPVSRFGDMEAISPLAFPKVLEEAKQCQALVIAAHVNEPKGLLRVVSPGQGLQQIVSDDGLCGVEVNSAEDTELLGYLDNQRSGYERRWGPLPQLTFSDAHKVADIGRRSTWIRMTRPDLEGLRLALLDGPLSILRAEDALSDPNAHARLMIESFEVVASKYVGFHEAFEQRLNPWLNAVIGGRGTGKSTLVEFLRIALRREAELPETLKKGLEDLRKVPENREDKGLLTKGTEIKVTYLRDGGRFRVQWSQDGGLAPILEERPDGSWREADGDVRQRFPVRIYSQKQIFELAEEPEALLSIVDDTPDVGYSSWEEEWLREEARFLALRARARQLEAELAAESRVRGELDDVRRKLAVFEQAGHDVDDNLRRLYQDDGGFEKRLKALKDRLTEWRGGGGEPVKDQRFVAHLSRLPPEVFDRLRLWFPPDFLKVSYSPAGRGRGFKSIDQGSPSQKTAALLAFLLSYGEEPIVLDQPEDDLDNHLIYELVVAQLREIKRRRQVVVVTHNPNIVVHGDAELVVALDARGGQTRQVCEGGLQEQKVRDEVCRVMEGGREAFEKRYARILAGGTNVRQL